MRVRYNSNMNIVFFEATADDQEYLSREMQEGAHAVTFAEERLTLDNAAQYSEAEIISVFVNSLITKGLIDAMPALKYITTRSTGFDHIDISYANSKNIIVSSVPSYGTHTVAEFTFALLLALSRHIVPASNQLRERTDFSMAGFQGFELFGKTIGVVGTGKIGKNAVMIAQGFGMKVLAYDVYPDAKFAEEKAFSYVPLEKLLAESDIVTLHAPYMETTHHLLNADNIPTMKKGAMVINTARGELIETDALAKALASGHLAGAALDVLEGERELKEEMELMQQGANIDYKTLFENHALMDMPNVLITPHIAFNTREAVQEILHTTMANIRAYISGTSQNVVQK